MVFSSLLDKIKETSQMPSLGRYLHFRLFWRGGSVSHLCGSRLSFLISVGPACAVFPWASYSPALGFRSSWFWAWLSIQLLLPPLQLRGEWGATYNMWAPALLPFKRDSQLLEQERTLDAIFCNPPCFTGENTEAQRWVAHLRSHSC